MQVIQYRLGKTNPSTIAKKTLDDGVEPTIGPARSYTPSFAWVRWQYRDVQQIHLVAAAGGIIEGRGEGNLRMGSGATQTPYGLQHAAPGKLTMAVGRITITL